MILCFANALPDKIERYEERGGETLLPSPSPTSLSTNLGVGLPCVCKASRWRDPMECIMQF